MLDFLLNILRALPVVSALLIVAAVNTHRRDRVRQTWLPVISIAFAVIALIVVYRINDGIDSSLASLSGALPWLPAPLGAIGLYLAENVLLLLIFVVIKVALRPLFGRFFAEGRSIAQFTAARIYEYSPEFQLWFVESRHARLRDFYRVAYWTSMGLAVVLIALASTFPDWPGFSAIAFPALAVLIIGEFYFAIDGLTQEEYTHSVYGERDISRRVGNFGPLRRVLHDAFPDWVLGEGVQLSSTASLDSGYRVGEMRRSPSPSLRLAGSYFDRLRGEGIDVDTNMVAAATDMMAGRGVLFSNPFYHDLSPYLSLAVYHELLEGRSCLIIAGRDSQARDLTDWIARGLTSVSGVAHLWRVRQLDAYSKEGADVGVLRAADIQNLEVLSNNDDFFRGVGLIILAEPSGLLTTGQLGLELIHDRCTQTGPVTVAAFDGNHDGLVDTLSHLTKTDITEVVASPLPQGASSEVVWRSGEPHMHTSILPGVTRFLGGGTEIAAVALKYQVRKVHWVGGDAFPVADMRWIAQQYFAPIGQFADLELSQHALAESLVAVPNSWALPQSDNYFLVVEDEMRNVYETVRQFATRATRSGFVNVICDDYLLRDYMVALRGMFAIDPKAIPSIAPDYARTERNVTLRLLLTLRAFGVTCEMLEKQLDLPSWTSPMDSSTEPGELSSELEPRVVRELRRLITQHTGVTAVPLAVAGSGLLDTPIAGDGDTTYVLQSGPEVDRVIDNLGPAYFFVEDDEDDHNVIGAILLDHVYQALLPGQFLTYGGKFYEVQGITSEQGQSRVILRRAADHIRERSFYRQVRSYTLRNLRSADRVGAVKTAGKIGLSRLVVDIEVDTHGYLHGSSRSDLAAAQRVEVSGVPRRHHPNKATLRIALPGTSPEVRATIAVLLAETFVTLFPRSHHYLAVTCEFDDHGLSDLMPTLTLDGPSEAPEDDAIYIVEDSLIDLGLVSAVERHWERLFEIITDYLAWSLEPAPEMEPAPSVVDAVGRFPARPREAQAEPPSFIARIQRMVRRLRPTGQTASPPTVSTTSDGAGDTVDSDVSDAELIDDTALASSIEAESLESTDPMRGSAQTPVSDGVEPDPQGQGPLDLSQGQGPLDLEAKADADPDEDPKSQLPQNPESQTSRATEGPFRPTESREDDDRP